MEADASNKYMFGSSLFWLLRELLKNMQLFS